MTYNTSNINTQKIKIIKPQIGGHRGDSFRELLDLWHEKKFIDLELGTPKRSPQYATDADSPESKCWIEKENNILLYDFPCLDKARHDYKLCLFGNAYEPGPKNKQWIFWPMCSRIYNDMKYSLRENTKIKKCCFIGTPTNLKRNQIAQYWSSICDVWYFTNVRIDHTEYLNRLSLCTFGLCLPGVGPKCLRDIEYMGMGVIPVLTDETTMDLYYNPPQKNIHYIYARDTDDFNNQIQNLSDKKIKEMKEACISWFEENCSIEGSFKTTMRIIEDSLE